MQTIVDFFEMIPNAMLLVLQVFMPSAELFHAYIALGILAVVLFFILIELLANRRVCEIIDQDELISQEDAEELHETKYNAKYYDMIAEKKSAYDRGVAHGQERQRNLDQKMINDMSNELAVARTMETLAANGNVLDDNTFQELKQQAEAVVSNLQVTYQFDSNKESNNE